jgi:hypothetical protein
MKNAWTLIAVLLSGQALASSIPTNLVFPLKNDKTKNEYRMADHPNSVFVFESYRLRCSYCNENAPAVDALATKYAANSRVQVLDAGLDTSNADYQSWINRHKPNHAVVHDIGRKVFDALKTVNGVPQVFVVNCKGELVGNFVGSWGNEGREKVEADVEQALETDCAQ